MKTPRDRFPEIVARNMPEEGDRLLSEAASLMGRKGAAKVNASRTPAERRRFAKKAVRIRWRRWRQQRRLGTAGGAGSAGA